ncbi:MAG TPA: hypothetical protein VFX18_01970 [Candidatus Nitrosocosmicus sp.]|nr:hypothetical protein [Candidatus Nitrosocosmicus sp.]
MKKDQIVEIKFHTPDDTYKALEIYHEKKKTFFGVGTNEIRTHVNMLYNLDMANVKYTITKRVN